MTRRPLGLLAALALGLLASLPLTAEASTLTTSRAPALTPPPAPTCAPIVTPQALLEDITEHLRVVDAELDRVFWSTTEEGPAREAAMIELQRLMSERQTLRQLRDGVFHMLVDPLAAGPDDDDSCTFGQ